MTCFNYEGYRVFLRDYIDSLPKNGRGFARRLAEAIGVSPVIISQVLGGTRQFSQEQAYACAQFLEFSPLEAEYFLCLLNIDRAGTIELKNYHLKQANHLKQKHANIKNRVKDKKELDDKAKAFYYANWYMVAIRLLVCNEKINSVDDIKSYIDISKEKIQTSLEFLEEYQLIKFDNEKYQWLGTSTHIPSDSPLVNRHHQNWRTRAVQKMEKENDAETELFFSSPMIIDKSCAQDIRKKILEYITETQKFSSKAPSENLFCLNIDFFNVK